MERHDGEHQNDDLDKPFNVWMIRTKPIQVNRDFDAHDGGVFLSEDGHRLWL